MSGSILEAMSFRKKPKQEIKRIEVSEYGEPKYQFTHRISLEEYREYNMNVSQHRSGQKAEKIRRYYYGSNFSRVSYIVNYEF